MLLGVGWQLVTDVWGRLFSPTCKGQSVMDCLVHVGPIHW